MEAGGWDENALTEDAGLSIRLYKAGWKVKFVPRAITWEQEPENLRVWLKQRERWVRGNNYVLKKLFIDFKSFKDKYEKHILCNPYVFYVLSAVAGSSDFCF